MIQRIQTLYLLLVLGCIALFLSQPLMGLLGIKSGYTLSAYVLENNSEVVVSKNIYMAILAIISFAITLVTIFIYKRRIIQIRLSIINIFLFIGHYAMITFYYFNYSTTFNASFGSVKIGALMPLFSIIFTLMAVRKINKDENLVRSLNRIR
jgi:hypothetical protein